MKYAATLLPTFDDKIAQNEVRKGILDLLVKINSVDSEVVALTGFLADTGAVDVASGAYFTLPGTDGTYRWLVNTYGVTVGGVKYGTNAAGTKPGTASGNCVVEYWRVT